jgi:uncharacterized protein YchJ
MEQERIKILTDAAEHRSREVMHHQINIDNYRLAIAEIDANHADDATLVEFKARLEELLASSIVEQSKEKIILKVIKQQLET